MPRRNLEGRYSGESERFTIRLAKVDARRLDTLAEAWAVDRSEAIRLALRQADRLERERRLAETLDRLATMTIAELRTLASDYNISGRSKMTKAGLRAALRAELPRLVR